MKNRHKQTLAAALGELLVAGAAPAAGPAKSVDQRAPLVLLDEERHIVLEEMRNFLAVLQTITDALTREDMKEIARAARSMGSGAANEIPPKTVAKLPEEFKVLAGGVHTTFDLMALDAESLADPKHTLTQMNELLQKCNACHGIYQIKVGKGGQSKR